MPRRCIESINAADVPYRVEHVEHRVRHVAAGGFGALSRWTSKDFRFCHVGSVAALGFVKQGMSLDCGFPVDSQAQPGLIVGGRRFRIGTRAPQEDAGFGGIQKNAR